jgi:hypothetical protein
MNLQDLADHVAARYAPGVLIPPAGEQDIRVATAEPPQSLTVFPIVLVYATSEPATFEEKVQTRISVVPVTVEFYLENSGDLKRRMQRLHKWAGVLLDAHLAHVQMELPMVVAVSRARSLQIGNLEYGGVPYPGISIVLAISCSEPITPVA